MQELRLPGGPGSGSSSLVTPVLKASSSTSTTANPSRSDISNIPDRLRSQLGSLEELLQLVVPPLSELLSGEGPLDALLQRLPPRIQTPALDEHAVKLVRSMSWSRDIQVALLSDVLPHWGPVLRGEGLWEALLDAWFFPPVAAQPESGKARVVDISAQEERGREGQLHLSALEVVSQALTNLSPSSAPATARPTHPETRRALLRICERLPSSLSFAAMWSSASSLSNEARRQVAMDHAVRLVISVRDKVGNAFGKEMPAVWKESSYVKFLARLLDELISSRISGEQAPSSTWTSPRAFLLSRLVRQGHFAAGRSSSEVSLALELVRLALARGGKGRELAWDDWYRSAWASAIGAVGFGERARIRAAIIDVLDATLRARGLEGLLSGGEQQEGEKFLGREARRLESSALAMLELFMALGIGGPLRDEDDGSDMEDFIALAVSDLDFEVRSTSGIRTPIMARTLVALALKNSTTEDEKRHWVLSVVRCWAKPERVRRTSRSEEIYLSTLLIDSLGRLDDSSIPASLQTNPSFLTGVSAHMDSNDALVRRMGMLVAELVSAGAVSNKSSEDGKTKKPLSFGSSMWAGKGEGREEARVLRKLWEEQRKPEDTVEDVPDQSWLQLWGLEAVKTEAKQEHLPIELSVQLKKAKSQTTRRLPERRPPQPSQSTQSELDLLGSLRPAVRRPLIVDIDAAEGDDDGDKAVKPLQGFAMPAEEEDEGSSSEGESSGDEDDDELGALKGLSGINLDEAGLGGLAGKGSKPEAGEAPDDGLGSNLPAQKRRRPPIYINEVSPMLKESDRDANRVAIKHAADLIRRKTGWGGEVDENAVDLAYVLTGAQNNYGIKSFEERRREALQALVVASPRNAAPCLIELLFSFQYSLAQRVALLQALAGAARELAGLPPLPDPSKADALHSDVLEAAAERATDEAVKRARNEGERRVPEIQRQKAVLIKTKPRIQEISPFGASSASSTRLSGAVTRAQERYADIASASFLFPFIGRLRAQLEDANHRDALRRSRKGLGAGIGSSSILGPMMLSRIVDTLSVLVSSAATSLDMASSIAPEALELALFVTVTIVPYLSAVPTLGDLGGPGDKGAKDNASALSGALSGLVLVTLDAACEADGGRWLMRNRRELVKDVREWAQAVFEEEDKKDRVAAAMGRAGRASASVLLRLHEMEEDS